QGLWGGGGGGQERPRGGGRRGRRPRQQRKRRSPSRAGAAIVMTGTALSTPESAPVAARHQATGRVFAQTVAMARRSIIAVVRQPAMIVPSLIFPLFFAALGASSFSRATALPGFPRVD